MKKLRQCKRCKEIFIAKGKYGTICSDCKISTGGKLIVKKKGIDQVLNSYSWRFLKQKPKITT